MIAIIIIIMIGRRILIRISNVIILVKYTFMSKTFKYIMKLQLYADLK